MNGQDQSSIDHNRTVSDYLMKLTQEQLHHGWKCLTGEHEIDSSLDYPAIVRYKATSPKAWICKHCRCLFVVKP